jgi:cell filamentation protein
VSDAYTDSAGVFYNKLGIADAELLREAEYALAAHRADDILSGRVVLEVEGYGLQRLTAIHKYLFQDTYEWAGKTRTMTLSKRFADKVSMFAVPAAIEPYWQLLEQKSNAFVSDKDMNFEQKREALTEIFVEANSIHPFREGNGRSLQIFMQQLAHEQGVELDYGRLNARDWNYASAVSGTHGRFFDRVHLIPEQPNSEPIRKLFTDISVPAFSAERRHEKPAALFRPETGKIYEGPIVRGDERHLFQMSKIEGKSVLIQHNRLELSAVDGKNLEVGANVQIRYPHPKIGVAKALEGKTAETPALRRPGAAYGGG